MADRKGISYLRTSRGAAATLYGPDEEFSIGGSRTVRDGDDITLAGCGVTVHEALRAADALEDEGVSARVLDLYSIKPIDLAALRAAASQTEGIVVAEDHWPEGGLGEALLSALAGAGERPAVATLAVKAMPGSGKPAYPLAAAGSDAAAIADAARRLLRAGGRTRGTVAAHARS